MDCLTQEVLEGKLSVPSLIHRNHLTNIPVGLALCNTITHYCHPVNSPAFLLIPPKMPASYSLVVPPNEFVAEIQIFFLQ